ncbi:uncharacterized protein LOC129612052 [Condylostylus longicornis]|uniref:uncharacterized protein LOC129612052 n=1 Tax=Condylostylus longicornis TaxID=2530218 RepID=UPI00244DBF25|nr:uncharacterized protein LOC129612052 [Condylostylus longicornis]XP_055381473.1 uncharacterized protein LOC129612052 [Condylostylus longicornis]XP_055381474.1 uncharacterized protein LOC129612052 [Condylostylus longicornis]XP_055381475.1 uncharacterized protein LOC129612052 [Condylostylus longicornis]
MHTACGIKNVATTASTATTSETASGVININNLQEQTLIHNLEYNNCNRDNSHNNHNSHSNNSPNKTCSLKNSCNDDDLLFISASSSITDFCEKIPTPSERSTINNLAEVSDFLSLTPSTPNKTKLVISKPQIIKRASKNSTDIEEIPVSADFKSTIFEPELSSNLTNSLTCSNTSSHSICPSVKSEALPPNAITINNDNGNSATPQSALETTEMSASSKKESTTLAKSVVSPNLFQRIEYGDLLQWKDMPKHLQFNPYVLTGYRPLSSFGGCVFSLFYWHNETINILTHGIPIVYILATVPSLMPWEGDFRFLSFCHIFGAVAPWCGSFVYHLFMNLEHGENIYYRLLQIDMVGIWISQSFGALPMVTASVYCFGSKMKWFMIIGYCILSLWGLYKALNASSPWQRRLCFALPFTMRVFLTFFRTLRWVGGNPQALTHVYLQDLVSVFGGAIGAMHIPEKWFPGSVDLYLNSHNIMHVLVVVAVYSMHKATVSDFEWMSKIECNYFYNSTTTIENSINHNFEL